MVRNPLGWCGPILHDVLCAEADMFHALLGSRGGSSAMRSQSSSLHNFGYASDPYADDPYLGFSSSTRSVDRRLGEVNPDEIEDDGDDGLRYPRHNQRNSMLSSAANSDRGTRSAIGAAAVVGSAAAAGGAVGGLLRRNGETQIMTPVNHVSGASANDWSQVGPNITSQMVPKNWATGIRRRG